MYALAWWLPNADAGLLDRPMTIADATPNDSSNPKLSEFPMLSTLAPSEHLHDSKSGRCAAAIAHLLLIRRFRWHANFPNQGLGSAHARQTLRAPTSSSRVMAESLLHDSVFARVVGQHRDSATRTGVSHCKVEGSGQNGEFLVHRDAKSLESPLGRMTSPTASWCRNCRRDDVGQVHGRSDRPCRNDRSRDSQRKALVSEVPEHARQFLLGCAIDEISCGSILAPVHSHVQWCIESVREASLGDIELMR
jgi:hypothetical protein